MSLNSSLTLQKHQQLIKRKRFLYQVYLDFYNEFGVKNLKKPVVELGSGGGFLKELYPKVITSDVIRGEGVDKVFKAEKMPFKIADVGSFVMLDTFHHIKDPEKALNEINRVLKVGGKIVMVEPFNSIWGRFIYQNFHHEKFNPESGWKTLGSGRLTDANGAIPWVVFIRDKKIFQEKFPNFKLIKIKPHSPLKYLISGGLSKPQLLPSWTYRWVAEFEKKLSFLNRWWGMFVTIEIQKMYTLESEKSKK